MREHGPASADPRPAVSAASHELVRWAIIRIPEHPDIIVLVVDDSEDDEITHLIAAGAEATSGRFGGVWGSGQQNGNWIVAFQLIELGGGRAGISRRWYTSNVYRELLDAILDVPHLVAILPAEIAGDATTAEDMVQRLAGSLLVGVAHRSPQVTHVLAEINQRERRRHAPAPSSSTPSPTHQSEPSRNGHINHTPWLAAARRC